MFASFSFGDSPAISRVPALASVPDVASCHDLLPRCSGDGMLLMLLQKQGSCYSRSRVSFEFDSKQLKLVAALSETKRLFRLFRFYTKTEIFDVSIEPKQTEDQPKQIDMEHILVFFQEM